MKSEKLIYSNINLIKRRLVDTKSGEKENVPLNEEAEGLVFEIARERKIDLKNLAQKQKSEHVFLGRYGRHMKDIRKQMQVTFQKAVIEYRPFHTFRHFWTSEMFNAGVDVGKIKKIGRWRDLTTMPFPPHHIIKSSANNYYRRPVHGHSAPDGPEMLCHKYLFVKDLTLRGRFLQ